MALMVERRSLSLPISSRLPMASISSMKITARRLMRARLNKDLGEWNRLVEAMGAVLGATRAEVLA